MPYKEFDLSGIGTIKIYKRRTNRSLRLTVGADGTIRVTMPLWSPYRAGLAFASARRGWILTHLPQGQTALAHGQKVGKAHHLAFCQDVAATGVRANLRQSEIRITYGGDQSAASPEVQAAARKACERALRTQSAQLLGRRLSQLASLHGMSYRAFTVKRMKTRWGSCDQDSGIVLNVYLVQLPWDLIDYVILHELAHTKVLHHGPDFWRQLESLLPDARRRRTAMRAYRPALLVA